MSIYFSSRISKSESAEIARRCSGDHNTAQKERDAEIAPRRAEIESISARSIREAEAAPFKAAQQAYEENFRALFENQEASIFSAPDPYGVFVDPTGYASRQQGSSGHRHHFGDRHRDVHEQQ